MTTSYDIGFLDGLKKAKEIMLRRDVHSATIRWITSEIEKLEGARE